METIQLKNGGRHHIEIGAGILCNNRFIRDHNRQLATESRVQDICKNCQKTVDRLIRIHLKGRSKNGRDMETNQGL